MSGWDRADPLPRLHRVGVDLDDLGEGGWPPGGVDDVDMGSHWKPGYITYPGPVKSFGRFSTPRMGRFSAVDDKHDRLRRARIDAGFVGPVEAAQRFGWSVNTYKSNENGNAPFSYKKGKVYAEAFGVRPDWLYDGAGEMREVKDARMVPVIGRVGANPDGAILLATGDRDSEVVPIPPGGTSKAAALLVKGHSMPDVAEDGALLYFEDQRTPPTEDMLGKVVVVETESDEVLVKRLLRGSRKGLYDLESLVGEPRRDVRLRWAARITAIIPPYQASKIRRS